MATDAPPLISDAEPTLGQLVASASRDVSTILRSEIALAKTEITGAAKFAGKGAGMFAGGGVLRPVRPGFLLTALAWGLVALGLATWLAFLIVAVLLFIGAAVLALVGKKALAHADPTPKRAISEAQQTIATIKGQS
jgi:hypothetical protein